MPLMRRPNRWWRPIAVVGVLAGWLVAAAPVAAHGPVPAEPPTFANLLLGWTFEPLPTLAVAVAAGWWWWAVRQVDRAHPTNRVPRWRTLAFGLGLLAIAFALLSGIDTYDTTLFSIHMVQHVLLTLVAAPLIAVAGPVTLLLRVSSPEARRRRWLPILHSRVMRVLAFPVVAWLAFATVMWVAHFSPLFDASLENPLVHDLEHALFLGSALLFWWPAVGTDPAPWRMAHPARIGYTFLQMTQNTFLSVVILGATTVLYHHYATLVIPWGGDPLDDQKLAAGIMWIAGDLCFLTAILGIVWAWMRAESRHAAAADRQADVEMAEIRVREQRLAERLARERAEATDGSQPGSGAAR
jgi:putative copper resistance protein D